MCAAHVFTLLPSVDKHIAREVLLSEGNAPIRTDTQSDVTCDDVALTTGYQQRLIMTDYKSLIDA